MILHDTLDKMATKYIPEGIHEMLHVNSREAWVNLVAKVLEHHKTRVSSKEMKMMLDNWEFLLYTQYSKLN